MKNFAQGGSKLSWTERIAKNLAIVLIVFTTLIALNLSSDALETRSNPLISEKAKGGLFVLAEFLRANGYRVTSDFTPSPQLKPGKLYIEAFKVETEFNSERNQEAAQKNHKEKATKPGTTKLILVTPSNFADITRGNKFRPTRMTGLKSTDTFEVSLADIEEFFTPQLVTSDDENLLTRGIAGQEIPVAAVRVNGGVQCAYLAGTSLLNQQIGANDHAKAILYVVEKLAGKDKEIVFLENKLLGETGAGLIASIGPWATTALYQIVFLVLVVLYSLNKVFGLAIKSAPYQRGTADALFAIGNLYQITGNDAWVGDQLAMKAKEKLFKIERSGRHLNIEVTSPIHTQIKNLERGLLPLKEVIQTWASIFNQIELIEDQMHTQKSYRIKQ